MSIFGHFDVLFDFEIKVLAWNKLLLPNSDNKYNVKDDDKLAANSFFELLKIMTVIMKCGTSTKTILISLESQESLLSNRI